MLKTFRERGAASLWAALIGLLLAMGLLLPVMQALSVDGASLAIWAGVITALCCAVAGLGGRFMLLGLAACVAANFLLMAMTDTLSDLAGMVASVVRLVQGDSQSVQAYGPEIAVTLGFILTLAGWSMARSSGGFYPALSLAMVVLLVIWFSANREAIWLFAPALVALCALFAMTASEDTPTLRVVTAAALVVVIAMLASPTLQFRSQKMENFADALRTYITDTLFFTETRSVYSIQVDGYKPLENRLGGPVTLENRPVMTVNTPTTIYLRGAIYNDYNGVNWRTSLSSRRYLYADPRTRTSRADIMDEERPSAALQQNDLFRLANIQVTMHSDSASSLFVPLRTQELVTPMALVPYFNLSSELFITRSLQTGDTYTLSAPVLLSADSRMPSMLQRAAMENTERRDMSDFLGYPKEVAPGVISIAQEITANAETPLEMAQAIQRYLQTAFVYSLSPSVPPDNQDFVSHFVLVEKKGYCTYFATAMAVMGRIVGLPTRYVEGYLVQPVGGVAQVTSKQAHAWTEVYFDGFGWVTFDATPPESAGGPRREQVDQNWENTDPLPQGETEEEQPQSEEDNPDENDDQQDQTDPDEDAPDQSDMGGNQPEEDEQGASGEEEPTPPPQTPEEQEQDMNGPSQKRNSTWWIWLLLAVAIGLLVWRGLWTRPQMVASRHTGDSAKLLVWYRALLGLLASAGMASRPYETPMAYATRVEKGIPPEAGLMEVASEVTRLGYGHRKTAPEQVQKAQACYQAVWHKVSWPARAKWLVRRMIKGLGSVRQVP